MNHSTEPLCLMSAVELLEALRKKKVSARELMQAHLKQVRRVNGKVNALVTLVAEDELMAQAARADESLCAPAVRQRCPRQTRTGVTPFGRRSWHVSVALTVCNAITGLTSE